MCRKDYCMKFLIFLIFFSLSGFSQRGYKDFKTRHIISIIKNNNVRTIEELLSYLPKSLRSNYTLQHTSKGLQGASSKYPRVFLASKRGDFFLTFNGFYKHKGYNKVEILELDSRTKRFNLFEFSFDRRYTKGYRVLKNPKKCLACHGNNKGEIHPIFEDYDENFNTPDLPNNLAWPGFYGESHDFESNLSEIRKFNNVTRKENSRYRFLLDSNRAPYPNKYKDVSPYRYKLSEPSYYYRPNLIFLNYFHVSNLKRLHATFKSNKNFKRVLPFIKFFNIFYYPKFNRDLPWKSYAKPLNFSVKAISEKLSKVNMNVHLKDKDVVRLKKYLYKLFNKEIPRNIPLNVITPEEFLSFFNLSFIDLSLQPLPQFKKYPKTFFTDGVYNGPYLSEFYIISNHELCKDLNKYYPQYYKPVAKFDQIFRERSRNDDLDASKSIGRDNNYYAYAAAFDKCSKSKIIRNHRDGPNANILKQVVENILRIY